MVFLKDQQTSARQWDSIWFGQRRVFAPETIPELIGQFRRQRRLCYRRHLLCQHAAQRPRAGASRTDVGLLRGGGRGSQWGWKQRGKKTPSTPSNSTVLLTAIDWLTTNDYADRGLEDLSLKTGCGKNKAEEKFHSDKDTKGRVWSEHNFINIGLWLPRRCSWGEKRQLEDHTFPLNHPACANLNRKRKMSNS